MKNRHLTIPIASLVAVSMVACPLHAANASAAAVSGAAVSSAPAPGPGPTAVSEPTSTASAAVPAKNAPPHTVAYTVVKGDTLTKLATKYNSTRKKLKDLNNLSSYKITPGQVIYLPATKKAEAAAAKAKHHTYLAAQPVQDFDVPASNFASCPVPVPADNPDDTYATPPGEKAAPIAQLVSPAELSADEAKRKRAAATEANTMPAEIAPERLTATLAPARLALPPEPAASGKTKSKHKLAAFATSTAKPAPLGPPAPPPQVLAAAQQKSATSKPAPSGWANNSAHHFAQTPMNPPPAPRPVGSHFWNIFGSHSDGDITMDTPAYSPSNEWGYKFLKASRALGDRGIDYDDDWRPPGERSSWTMDCSNTSRWLYKSVAGINLPRTASDQYYYLHLQGKAWDVPSGPTGWADVEYLQKHLKPGDLLFWENTYRPERQPPITHVMVFLGTNERGQWIMAGSQSSRGGEHNRRDGGPDVYVFRPSQPCGGYTSWFVHHQGRFCAFGRPLEADPSKFALND